MRIMNYFICFLVVVTGISASIGCVPQGEDPAKPPPIAIGGTVTGLVGELLISDAIGGTEVTLTLNGTYNFFSDVSVGKEYKLSIVSQPEGLTCVISESFGIANTSVENIKIDCVNPAISEVTELFFPDAALRDCVINSGKVMASDIHTLNCAQLAIENATGIEQLKSLTSLNLSRNRLKSVDLSQNKLIESLILNDNFISHIDVGANTALTDLQIENNHLEDLDLSSNSQLLNVSLRGNIFSKIVREELKALAASSPFSIRMNLGPHRNDPIGYVPIISDDLSVLLPIFEPTPLVSSSKPVWEQIYLKYYKGFGLRAETHLQYSRSEDGNYLLQVNGTYWNQLNGFPAPWYILKQTIYAIDYQDNILVSHHIERGLQGADWLGRDPDDKPYSAVILIPRGHGDRIREFRIDWEFENNDKGYAIAIVNIADAAWKALTEDPEVIIKGAVAIIVGIFTQEWSNTITWFAGVSDRYIAYVAAIGLERSGAMAAIDQLEDGWRFFSHVFINGVPSSISELTDAAYDAAVATGGDIIQDEMERLESTVFYYRNVFGDPTIIQPFRVPPQAQAAVENL